MKNNYPLFILFIIISLLASCGDDSTTNNNNTPAGTVLYSKDSLSVWIQSGTSFVSDSVSFATSETGGVKVEFQVQSNADSSLHAIGFYRYYSNATPAIVMLSDIYFPIDNQHNGNFNLASGSTYFSFVTKITTNGAIQPFYVRLKNIKITKL